MIYNLYTYYDRVSGLYSPPVPAVNRATAIRSFLDVQKSNTSANDVELYEIGSLNIQTGDMVSKKPEFVCTFSEYNSEVK